MIEWLCIAAVIFAASPSVAHADWSAAAFVGGAHTASSSLHVRQPGRSTDLLFSPVVYAGESFRSPIYYGYRLRYLFRSPSWFGLEGEVIHLKVFAETGKSATVQGVLAGAAITRSAPIADIVQRFSISHGVNLALVNAVGRRRLGTAHGRFALIGRAGAGITVPHAESAIRGQSTEHYQLGSFAFQLASGAEMAVRGGLAVLAEYKYSRTRQSVDVAEGTATTLLSSHHAVVGLSYQF